MSATQQGARAVIISALLAGSCARLAFAADLEQTAPPLDRYGGGRHYLTQTDQMLGQKLTWAGKVERSAQAPPIATQTPGNTELALAQTARAVAPAPETNAPSFATRPSLSAGMVPSRPWARLADDAISGSDTRLYSLHREFGLTPDPIPPAPLTFTGSADLAADDAAAAAPQPNRTTAAGRTAITQDRINDSGDGQP